MIHLRMQDEDLEAGSIYVKSMIKTIYGTLNLQTRKVLFFLQLHPQGKAPVLKKKNSDRLIITFRGIKRTGSRKSTGRAGWKS